MSNHKLIELKARLKNTLPKGNKSTVAQLLNIVNQKSDVYNYLISIQSQIKELENDEISGTIDDNNKSIRRNKINQAIIKYIENLQIQDLLWVDENNPSVKFLFEYISSYTLLEHKNTELVKENEVLKNEIQQLKYQINEYENKLKVSEVIETIDSETHTQLTKFFQAYHDTLSFYPKIFLVFQNLSKEEFFEEEVTRNLLDFYSKPLLRDLEYARFFLIEVEGKLFYYDINGNAMPLTETYDQELFSSYKELNAFRLNLTTDATMEDIEYLVEEAENLLDDVSKVQEY